MQIWGKATGVNWVDVWEMRMLRKNGQCSEQSQKKKNELGWALQFGVERK